jgi:hypothetical protein
MNKMESREDILNNIAGRITNYIHGIGTESCKLCEGFTDYKGKCIGYSWDITYHPPTISGEQGIWNFSLYHHRKEIWYVSKEGTIVDIILSAYEKLVSGQWREDITEKSWRRQGDKL